MFLHEYGSIQAPLPPKYYVPGDRLWFRNPDEHLSDVSGYGGSWIFYLGDGLFTNFWKCERPYTLVSKCVEVFYGRHATFTDGEGDLRVQENIVEQCVSQTLTDRAQTAEVMQTLLHLRAPPRAFTPQVAASTRPANTRARCARRRPTWCCPHPDGGSDRSTVAINTIATRAGIYWTASTFYPQSAAGRARRRRLLR